MASTTIRHILVRHEQGAGHAAEGYASSSNKVGVAIATLGAGRDEPRHRDRGRAHDSVPLLVITGQVFSTLMGTDAFQEVDIVGITMPITKHSFLVTRPEDVPRDARGRPTRSRAPGRPGPVLVDITKDAQQDRAPYIWPPKIDLPGYRPVLKAHGKQIQAAAQLLADAKRPVLYVGGGVIRAKASEELLVLAEKDRRGRGDDAHGPRRLPRLSPAEPRHAGHARHGSRGARDPGERPAHLARGPLSTTASRARSATSRPTPRSCTSISIPRRSRRYRSRGDLQDPRRRCPHRRRCQGRHRRLDCRL
ncbi:MAG: thiamine pyrophosphate-binding protein [Galbitalea sp.]